MSLASRLTEFIAAVGADIKSLQARPVIRFGVGAPDSNTGNIGEYYMDTASGILYGPKPGLTLRTDTPNIPGNMHPDPTVDLFTNWTGTASTGAGNPAAVLEKAQAWASDGLNSAHYKVYRDAAANTTAILSTQGNNVAANINVVDPTLPYSMGMKVRVREFTRAVLGAGTTRLLLRAQLNNSSGVSVGVRDVTLLGADVVDGAVYDFILENFLPGSVNVNAARLRLQFIGAWAAGNGPSAVLDVDVDSLVLVQAEALPRVTLWPTIGKLSPV